MAIGKLVGYAVKAHPSVLNGDHTYVVAEDGSGRAWGCIGRASDPNGREICNGLGSVDQAQCLARTDGTAGIRWGITGVCHQAANRILHPAGVFVSAALGYRRSIALYGAYGRVFPKGPHYSPSGKFQWDELKACLNNNHNHN